MAGLTGDALAEEALSADLRLVIDLTLDHVDGLIDLARPLPARIADRRLRCQAAVTVAVAERLARLLRRADPLARKVRLAPLDYAGAMVNGIARGLGFGG